MTYEMLENAAIGMGNAISAISTQQALSAAFVIAIGAGIINLQNSWMTILQNDTQQVNVANLQYPPNPAAVEQAQEQYQTDTTRMNGEVGQAQTILQAATTQLQQLGAAMGSFFNLDGPLNEFMNTITSLINTV